METAIATKATVNVSNIKTASVEIDITRPVLLVGENGSGKSAIINGIELAVTGAVSGLGRQASALGELSCSVNANASVTIGEACYDRIIQRKSGKFSVKDAGDKPKRDLRIPLLVQDMMKMTSGELQKIIAPAFEGKICMESYTENILAGMPSGYDEILMISIPNSGELSAQDLQQKVDEFDALKRATMKTVSDLEKAIVEIDAATPRSEISDSKAKELDAQLSKAIGESLELNRVINNASNIEAEILGYNQEIETCTSQLSGAKLLLDSLIEKRDRLQPKEVIATSIKQVIEDNQAMIDAAKERLAKLLGEHPSDDTLDSIERRMESLLVDVIAFSKEADAMFQGTAMKQLSSVASECSKWIKESCKRSKKIRDTPKIVQSQEKVAELNAKQLKLQDELAAIEAELSDCPPPERISNGKSVIENLETRIRTCILKRDGVNPMSSGDAAKRLKEVDDEIANLKETLSQHREVKAQKILRTKAEKTLAENQDRVEPVKELVKAAKRELANERSKFCGKFMSTVDAWCEHTQSGPITFLIEEKGISILHGGRTVDVLGGGEKLLALTGVLVALNISTNQTPSVVLVEGAELDSKNLELLCNGLTMFADEIDIAVATSFVKPTFTNAMQVVDV